MDRFSYIYTWLCMVAWMGLSSCTEIIDIDLDSTYQRIVVYGTITNDSVQHQVHLSTSSDYFSNKPSPRISGALVELEFDNRFMTLEAHSSIPGLYLTPQAFRGIPGTTYRLSISQVDVDMDGEEETYYAESTMPAVPLLDSIKLAYFRSPFVSGYQVFMYAMDSPERNWYSFKLWKNHLLLTDRLSSYTVQSDDFVNGEYIYGLPVGFLSDDDPAEAVSPGDTITFELNSIGEEYSSFITDAQLEIFGNNPLFSGPPANVRSNVEKDGKGIFAAYAISRISVVVDVK